MIEDNTPSGVPLPHPGNPARADIVRVRNALTALDTRLVTAGEAVETLEDAIEAEELARQQAVAEEENARIDAVAAEATARANADTALQATIDGLFIPDVSTYYTKSQVDALIAATKPEDIEVIISSPVATVDFTVNPDDRYVHISWDDVSHNNASSQKIELRYSSDAGASWSSAVAAMPNLAVDNTILITGGVHLWLMSDETATGFSTSSSSGQTSAGGGGISGLIFDPPARINRLRLQWAAGSFNAGVVRCRRGK